MIYGVKRQTFRHAKPWKSQQTAVSRHYLSQLGPQNGVAEKPRTSIAAGACLILKRSQRVPFQFPAREQRLTGTTISDRKPDEIRLRNRTQLHKLNVRIPR
jgi:hypothetical protein